MEFTSINLKVADKVASLFINDNLVSVVRKAILTCERTEVDMEDNSRLNLPDMFLPLNLVFQHLDVDPNSSMGYLWSSKSVSNDKNKIRFSIDVKLGTFLFKVEGNELIDLKLGDQEPPPFFTLELDASSGATDFASLVVRQSLL